MLRNFLGFPESRAPKPGGDGGRAKERSDLKDGTLADLRHVINQHENIDIEHRMIGRFHQPMMQRLLITVLDQPLH